MNPRLVHLVWADGEYPFALNIGQVRELEGLQKIGIGAILNRLIGNDWFLDDIYHVIRLGLIGGGMSPEDAYRKVKEAVADRPFAEMRPFAQVVLMACLFGNDATKKETVGETEAETLPTE